jgi:hypothetical protein
VFHHGSNFEGSRDLSRASFSFCAIIGRDTLRVGEAQDQTKTFVTTGLVPVVPAVPIVMVVVVGVICVEMSVVWVITVVMMVVRMMIIAVPPSCGWSRAADCDCADNS